MIGYDDLMLICKEIDVRPDGLESVETWGIETQGFSTFVLAYSTNVADSVVVLPLNTAILALLIGGFDIGYRAALLAHRRGIGPFADVEIPDTLEAG